MRETQRAVIPLGGIAVFLLFQEKIGFVEAVRQYMSIRGRSPNHIDRTSTFTAFLVSCCIATPSLRGGSRRLSFPRRLRIL